MQNRPDNGRTVVKIITQPQKHQGTKNKNLINPQITQIVTDFKRTFFIPNYAALPKLIAKKGNILKRG